MGDRVVVFPRDYGLRDKLARASARSAQMVGVWARVKLKRHGVDCGRSGSSATRRPTSKVATCWAQFGHSTPLTTRSAKPARSDVRLAIARMACLEVAHIYDTHRLPCTARDSARRDVSEVSVENCCLSCSTSAVVSPHVSTASNGGWSASAFQRSSASCSCRTWSCVLLQQRP